MQANYVQRMRLRFSKGGAARFIGHLDLARTLERALNRAHIPVAYTQGFNRRPRMQFASALPLGFTSEAELADVWLAETMQPDQFHEQLMEKMAPGLVVHEVSEVPLQGAPLQTITARAEYVADVTGVVDPETLETRVQSFLAAEEVKRVRRGKRYDLRPLVHTLRLESGPDKLHLCMALILEPSRTGRPDEVLAALELDPLDARVHRTAIILAEPESSV